MVVEDSQLLPLLQYTVYHHLAVAVDTVVGHTTVLVADDMAVALVDRKTVDAWVGVRQSSKDVDTE